MTTLTTTASVEIATDGGLSAKALYQLRRRLEEAFEETAASVLAEFDLVNTLSHAVRVDEIEVNAEEGS